jgi:hypothetical protein
LPAGGDIVPHANSADTALQTSFNTLVSTLGGSTGSASLSGFLQAFASDLKDASAVGGVLNTQA